MRKITWFIISCFFIPMIGNAQILSQAVPVIKQTQTSIGSGPVVQFEFEGNLNSVTGTSVKGVVGGKVSFVKSLDGQALSLVSNGPSGFVELQRDWV